MKGNLTHYVVFYFTTVRFINSVSLSKFSLVHFYHEYYIIHIIYIVVVIFYFAILFIIFDYIYYYLEPITTIAFL